MKKIKVGINGFGRIGRAFLKLAWKRPELEIVGINDLGSLESLAYLLMHDSIYRESLFQVAPGTHKNGVGVLKIWPNPDYFSPEEGGGKVFEIPVFSEKDPALIPWGKYGVDVAVECTGLFTSFEKSEAHIRAGAKRAVISAPSKGESAVKGETILLGVNEDKFGTCAITSNASCTTNAASPLIAILDEAIGIKKAILNTVHGYTASQALVDGPSKKDLREGRAAAQNIVPSSTGAAIAVTQAYPSLSGKFDGISVRVPVPAGSIVDVTFLAKKKTTAEEVNALLTKATREKRWKGIFQVTNEPLVSTDILGKAYASIADLLMTRVVDGDLVKVMAWYDNEMGYTHTLVEHTIKTGKTIRR